MRDAQTIEREIDLARDRLEHDIAELKDIVKDKLDFKKRAREVADRGKHEAIELYHRARTNTVRMANDVKRRATTQYRLGVVRVRQHPGILLSVVLGMVALSGVILWGAHQRRSTWYGRHC
jgi:hypothetical protein